MLISAHSTVTLLFLLRSVLVGAAGDYATDAVHGTEAGHIPMMVLIVCIFTTFLFFVSDTCLLQLWLRNHGLSIGCYSGRLAPTCLYDSSSCCLVHNSVLTTRATNIVSG